MNELYTFIVNRINSGYFVIPGTGESFTTDARQHPKMYPESNTFPLFVR